MQPIPQLSGNNKDFAWTPASVSESISATGSAPASLVPVYVANRSGTMNHPSLYQFDHLGRSFIPSSSTLDMVNNIGAIPVAHTDIPEHDFTAYDSVWHGIPSTRASTICEDVVPRRYDTGPRRCRDNNILQHAQLDGIAKASIQGGRQSPSPNPIIPASRRLNTESRHSSIMGSVSSVVATVSSDFSMPATHSLFDLNTEQPQPFTQSRGCSTQCYTVLVRALLHLNSIVSYGTIPSVEEILQLEDDGRYCKKILLACATCLQNRSSLLLLCVVVEQLVIIFERTVENGEPSVTESRHSGASTASFRGEERGKAATARGIDMLELDEKTQSQFVKHLLRLRLDRFTAAVRNLVESTTILVDSNCVAAKEIVTNSHERLKSLANDARFWK